MSMRLLILLAALWPCVSLAAGVVRVPADASVEGSEVRLGEIAQLESFPPELEQRLAALSFGSAASPGRARSFGGGALRQRIAELAPDATLEIPDEVRVHTAYREIDAAFVKARMEQALEHVLPWPAEGIQLSEWRLPQAFRVPAHASRFLVHFRSDERFLGRVTAQVEAVDPEHPDEARVQRSASVTVGVQLPIPVSARALRRGSLLEPDAVRMEPRDLRALPRDVVLQTDQVFGRALDRNVQEGVPLLLGYFESERLIRRGEALQVLAEQQGLELRIEARALEHGALGQSIRAENPVTRRRFVVQVTGPGQARLATNPQVGAQ